MSPESQACLLHMQVSAEMYSAPSIVLQSRGPDGSTHVFDDFRESYAWLRQNTDENAKVLSLPLPMIKCRLSSSAHPVLFYKLQQKPET